MGCKDLGIRKLEFVAKTQIQYIIKIRLFSLIFLIKLKLCKTKNLQKKIPITDCFRDSGLVWLVGLTGSDWLDNPCLGCMPRIG